MSYHIHDWFFKPTAGHPVATTFSQCNYCQQQPLQMQLLNSETTSHHPYRYRNYLKCATTGFTERHRFYFKTPGNQISPKFKIPKSENSKFEFLNPHNIPLGDETTTAALSTDFTSEFTQLRASVNQISIEHVKTRVHIEKLKAAIFTKISSLKSAFLARSETQERVVLVNNDVFCMEIKAQKAALSQEMDIFHNEVQDQKAALSNDLMEFRVQAHENYNTLTTQLSELVDYINRGGYAKKGEMSSGRGPPPLDDQSRSGGSSKIEPSKKREGGSQSISKQRGFRYWLG
ncbi:hypothetical protein F511_35127 [Dorcoceras hygrometricum]|uniref:Uncharacterized protein n=1 Tax=Dorcoceras hygrometricum TaxID=472368 RepID=A0A2Z7B8M1_9LAMI|nr:hypothetical protein F511_35127 [Dorcoceras hygrometricum]